MAESPPRAGRAWLMGPLADPLFVANWTWPLLALALIAVSRSGLTLGAKMSSLYALYLISTPHRWITLGLVALDRERRARKAQVLLGTAGWTVAFFLAACAAFRSVAALVLIQYFWNLWHVTAQHVGVARIYGIRARPERRETGALEKWGLRVLTFYASWRTLSLGAADYAAGIASSPWFARLSLADSRADWLVLGVPVVLLVRAARDFDRRQLGRLAHLASVCAHYSAMIALCRLGLTEWAVAVAMTNGAFHAIEYFSVVTWSVLPRAEKPGSWDWPVLFRHWGSTLAVFVLSVATLGLFVSTGHARVWIVLNALIAYLHYALDGVIWKMPDVLPAA